MYAMLDAQINTQGDMVFWSDSDILCKGWRKKKYNMKAYLGGNSDLWHRLGLALAAGSEANVEVRHIVSHLEREGAIQ